MEFVVDRPAKSGNKRKVFDKTLTADTHNGVDCEVFVGSQHSFDGSRWHVHDDVVYLQLDEVAEVDEETGAWEFNPDCSDEGCAWAVFTPEQAIALARKLLRLAHFCRRADEVDLTDPDLITACKASEAAIKAAWKAAEMEDDEPTAKPLLTPELEKAWQ